MFELTALILDVDRAQFVFSDEWGKKVRDWLSLEHLSDNLSPFLTVHLNE